jgi:hypothetical protein
VILKVLGTSQHARIANLARGGISVLTPLRPDESWVGSAVEVAIRLDAGHAEWLPASGNVVWLDGGGVGIAFDGASPSLLSMIEELTTASQANARVMSVVLIDADTERRAAMAAGFRDTGCDVIEAATPLEAIVRLGESSFEPDVIAVADSDSTAAADMREFVERNHSRAKLVTIGNDVLEPAGIAHWLSSANAEVGLANRVRDMLVRPSTDAQTRKQS